MSSLNAVAQKIVDRRPNPYLPEENLLFQYLYDAYCKLEQSDDSFEAVVASAKLADSSSDKYVAARQALVKWYADRYPPHEKKEKTNRGIARDVLQRNIDEGVYRFDEPVNMELFTKYLNDFPIRQHPFQTADARSFILHTAVAFLLSPEQLDHLLVTFGFHTLHVRHIHDMAIYVVLQDATQYWTPEERRERNPFQEVRDVYEDARQLLIQAQTTEPRELSEDEQAAFLSDSTRIVQQYIHRQNLSRENLLAYVGSHTEFYNLRHRRLLAEHKRLVNLFSELYVRGTWDGDEPKYSLYEFLTEYCKEFERKRFNDQIYGYVAKCGRHPTREFMIVLWIYAYSFLYCPEVMVSRDFRKIIPFERMNQSLGVPEEYPFADYYINDFMKLSVLEYLSDAMYDTRTKSSPLGREGDGWGGNVIFSGTELVVFINERLRSYSWHPLDSKNTFDRTVLGLVPLRITVKRDMGFEIKDTFYGNDPIDNAWAMNIDNVPGPLVVIFKLLQEKTDSDNTGKPLPCNMYELI